MKLVVLRDNFKGAVSAASIAVGGGSNLPIIKNILLEAVSGKIVVYGTDLEIAVVAECPAKVSEEGRICVPAGKLIEIAGNSSSDRLDISSEDYKLSVEFEGVKGLVLGANPEEFPIIPKNTKESLVIKIPSVLLKNSLSEVLSAASITETRPELSCLFMGYDLDCLKLACTDSFRLAERSIPSSSFTGPNEVLKAMLPVKAAFELMKLLNDSEDVVEILIESTQMTVNIKETRFISRLSDSKFPEYSSIIPKENKSSLYIKKSEIISALKMAGVFADKALEVSVRTRAKGVVFNCISQSVGEGETFVSAKIEGEEVDSVFNIRQLTEGLKAISGEDIVWGLNMEKASIIRSSKDSNFFYLIAPILKA